MHTDHIGRPVFATNDLGVKVWEASYLPFGGVHVATGGLDLRFPGQWFQAESGLHQNWMRDYDPTTGRYLEPDPLGLVDGASVYGYARQSPLRWTDPRGEQGISIPGGPFPGPGPAMGVAPGTPLGDALGNSAGDALEALRELSHNYNPIDLALQKIVEMCTPDECADRWEKEQADCGRKYGYCMMIAGDSRYRQKQCGREYGACMDTAKNRYLKCIGK